MIQKSRHQSERENKENDLTGVYITNTQFWIPKSGTTSTLRQNRGREGLGFFSFTFFWNELDHWNDCNDPCGWNVIIQPFTKVTWMDSKIKKNVFIVCYSRMKIVNKGSISNVKNNTIDDWMTTKYLFQVQRQSFQAHSKKADSFLSWFYFAVSSTAFWKEVYFPRMRRKSSFSDLNSDSDVSNSCF